MATQGVRVNGNAYSWGSIALTIDDLRYFQFSEVSFADKRERSKFFGMSKSQGATARSRGKYTTEPVKLKGLKEECDSLRSALSAANPNGTASYGDTEFNIYVEYSETLPDGTVKVTDVEIMSCYYVGTTNSETEGPDVLVEEIEIDCMRIMRNGLPLYDDSDLASA